MDGWHSYFHDHIYRPSQALTGGDVAQVLSGVDTTDDHPVRLLVRPVAGSFNEQALKDSLADLRYFQETNVARFRDAGLVDDGQAVFLAYEVVEGVSLRDAVGRRAEPVSQSQAITLVHDSLLGLLAMQRQGLHHGNISLDTIIIDRSKHFVLDLPTPPFLDVISPPAEHLSLDHLPFLAPERLAAEPITDIAGDCYALGSCFYALLTGGSLVMEEEREELVEHIKAGPYDEAEIQLGNQPDGIMAVCRCALHKDRPYRYRNPNDLRHDLNMVSARHPPDRAMGLLGSGDEEDIVPSSSARTSAALNVVDIERHLEAKEARSSRPPSTKTGGRRRPISARLRRLVKVSEDRMSARIKLGPGVQVQEELLYWILDSEGISHGVQEGGIMRAATPRNDIRRIVLAEGTAAAPGRPGFDVFGDIIRPPPDPIMIEIESEGIRAVAHVIQGQPIPEPIIRRKLAVAGVVRGVDEELIRTLADEGTEAETVIIAVGKEPTPGEPAGFRLLQGSLDPDADLVLVRRGERFAQWSAPKGGDEGFTVTGRMLAFEMPEGQPQELLAGPGTQIESKGSSTFLLAEQDGAVLQTAAGIIRVAPVVRVRGGLKAGVDPDPIDTDALVVIEGDVDDGAVLITSTDCRITGNLGDAEVLVGGELTVGGDILPGECKVSAGGALQATSVSGRHVHGNDVLIHGSIRDAMVVATATLRATEAIGGRLTAAESFHIESIGDDRETETVIWAGYHLPKAVERDLAQLHERRSSRDRELMIQEREVFARIIDQINHKNYMQHVLGYMQRDYKQDMYARYEQVRKRLSGVSDSLDDNQGDLADKRQAVHALDEEVVDQDAEVVIEGTLHSGVTIKIGEAHTRRIEKTQDQVRFKL